MKNKIKVLCLILTFLIVIVLSSKIVFSVFNINDNDCKRLCLEKDKSAGTNEFCYNALVSIRCDCSAYKFEHAVECDTTCQGYAQESKYCPPNSCEYICPWKRTACSEYETSLGTRTSFIYVPSSWSECEKRASEDMKCTDKDDSPIFSYDVSNWQSNLFLIRLSGLKDAYWQKCSVPKSMGDCGTSDNAVMCNENGCSISTIASAKLTVPANALSNQQDIIEKGQTIVNLGVIISVAKDYDFNYYSKIENKRIITIYNFYPNNLIFNKPSTLIIDYMHEIADGMIKNENGLDIYYYDNGIWLPLDALYNKQDKTLTTFINNLGVYALVESNDITPPTINLNVAPNILWPPNNKYVDVTLSGNITDDISGIDENSIILIVDNIKKEINLDNNGNFNIISPLLASRLGSEKQGHKYNISLTVSDNVGNIAFNSEFVLVPHDLNYNIEKTK